MTRGSGKLGAGSAIVMGCVFVGSVLAGCGGGSSAPSGAPTSPSTASTAIRSTTTSAPSADDTLSAYFAAAAGVDRRLRAAAAAANGDIGVSRITVSQQTLDAIAAADPSAAADAIPAGLPPSVLLPVLTVQSDLESRYESFRGFTAGTATAGQPGVIAVSDEHGHYLLTCLGNGSRAAASFADDVASARAAASRTPPVAPVDPSGRAAAELAVRLQDISGQNSGCMSCGGYRVTALAPITWHAVAPLTPGGNPWDGDIGGGLFAAHYTAGQGWTVQINAC